MIYRHKRTGVLYRKVGDGFSVERQRDSVYYISLLTGSLFDRDAEKFAANFEYVEDAQRKIIPKAPHD